MRRAGGGHPLPGAHSHTPPLTSHPFPQAVRACLLSQEHVAPGEEPAGCGAQRTGTEAPTTLPTGEREVGRGVHWREHARRPRDRWPADPRGQPSGPAPADSGVGRCSLPPGRHTPLLCCTGCWHLKRQTPCCSKIALVTSCEGPVSPFSPNGKETHALGRTMLLRLTDTPSVIGPLLSEASLPG